MNERDMVLERLIREYAVRVDKSVFLEDVYCEFSRRIRRECCRADAKIWVAKADYEDLRNGDRSSRPLRAVYYHGGFSRLMSMVDLELVALDSPPPGSLTATITQIRPEAGQSTNVFRLNRDFFLEPWPKV